MIMVISCIVILTGMVVPAYASEQVGHLSDSYRGLPSHVGLLNTATYDADSRMLALDFRELIDPSSVDGVVA